MENYLSLEDASVKFEIPIKNIYTLRDHSTTKKTSPILFFKFLKNIFHRFAFQIHFYS